MKITVLWEDQRGGQQKGFGPHDLLAACVADRLAINVGQIRPYLLSVPKKGNGNLVRRALACDLDRLPKTGPVFAVLDRDKVEELWKPDERPANCMAALRQRIVQEAPGSYDLVFLVENVESLVEDCCVTLRLAPGRRKPTPEGRDAILARAVWSADPSQRGRILDRRPSFKRLVGRVAEQMKGVLE